MKNNERINQLEGAVALGHGVAKPDVWQAAGKLLTVDELRVLRAMAAVLSGNLERQVKHPLPTWIRPEDVLDPRPGEGLDPVALGPEGTAARFRELLEIWRARNA